MTQGGALIGGAAGSAISSWVLAGLVVWVASAGGAAGPGWVAVEANVRDYGAKGDGKADDTAALQRAVDAGVGVVRLPKGLYRLSEPVVIDLDKVGYTTVRGDGVARIVMAGPGPALRFVGTHFKSADPPGFGAQVWERQRMPMVDGVAVVGEHTEALGVEAVGTMQLTITRLHVRGALHGIHLVGNNRNIIISDCHLYGNRGVGVYYDDVNLHQSNITGSHISYNGGGGVVTRAGNVRNIQITGCDLESNMDPKGPATANVLIDCAGSQSGAAEVAITGCTIQHNHVSPDSANIRILGRSEPGRGLEHVQEGHVTITGNVLSDVQVNVHLKECRGAVLQGNTFWMGYRHNLLIEDCSHVVVGVNNFDRNPRYNYGDATESLNNLVVRRSRDCTLSGLHVSLARGGEAAFLIEDCERFNLTNCSILDCEPVGLLLRNLRRSRVSGCLIRDDRGEAGSVSLQAEGGEGNMIVDNLLGGAPRIGEGTAVVKGNVYR